MPTYEDIIYTAENYDDIVVAIHQHPEHTEKLRGFLIEWVLLDYFEDADLPEPPENLTRTSRLVEKAMQRFWARLKEIKVSSP